MKILKIHNMEMLTANGVFHSFHSSREIIKKISHPLAILKNIIRFYLCILNVHENEFYVVIIF